MRLPLPDLSHVRLPSTAAALGALTSVLLHLLVFGAILFGPGAGPRLERKSGIGATALSSDNTPLGVLILIDASADGLHHDDPFDQLGSLGHLLQSPLLTIASPKVSLENFDFLDGPKADPAATDETTGDQRGRAALFGLYIRQVQARIERAWRHPKSAPATGSFACRVQISQSKRGEVREVQLLECSQDVPWRLSLVNAIDSASPLPAPPDPRVFADLLRMSFRAATAPAATAQPASSASTAASSVPPPQASQGP